MAVSSSRSCWEISMSSVFIVIALLPTDLGHALPACSCVHSSVRPRDCLVSLEGDARVLQT